MSLKKITCGENCVYIPYSCQYENQLLVNGFYYVNKGLYIGPFETIDELEESKRLGFVAEEIFELVC